ncbi:MAG: hypothetical protein EOP84_14580 [Verrucomicrobiaceae bacterium]|nr:MAG: hypothetical protein EOP84_14580 [Verrucomicrobiaceae bacterium]
MCQANETTRALTHYLYHADERIALVTHSQGCLIARNAILAASRMRGEEKPESLISWVALAAPLRDEEIIKKPRRLKVFANKNDFVAGGLGMRMMGGDDKKNLESGHNFERYLGYINEDMLF